MFTEEVSLFRMVINPERHKSTSMKDASKAAIKFSADFNFCFTHVYNFSHL